MDQSSAWPAQQPSGVSEQVLQQLAKELCTLPHADAAPAGIRDGSSQLLHSVLQSYTGNDVVQQPCSFGPPGDPLSAMTPAMLGPRPDVHDGFQVQAILPQARQLVPTLPRVMQPVSGQVTMLPDFGLPAQEPQPQPAVAANDAAQMAALVAALHDPHKRFSVNIPTSALSAAVGLGVSNGKISKPSTSAGDDMHIGPASTREKNRQAQQRFRQRQKDRITELEQENSMLRAQLAKTNQQLAQALVEIRRMRSS